MNTRLIRNEADYAAALAEVERLIDAGPKRGSRAADELEVLSVLVADYESKTVPRSMPDPIEAIKFRMEQVGLSQRDLVPFIGSRSKVSEVLARKRPLTLSMIRALHNGLGIPASVLVQDESATVADDPAIEWKRFPVREIVRRGWVDSPKGDPLDYSEELIRDLLSPLGRPGHTFRALYKRTTTVRSARTMDEYALVAWKARVLTLASRQSNLGHYEPGSVTVDFMRAVARLSWSEHGPLLAREFLLKAGIHLIVEAHLARTHLDGAALKAPDGSPIIALTIRHDRLDNFWFCLLHELAHIAKHFRECEAFIDDLDSPAAEDSVEAEADNTAREVLVPRNIWLKSPASRLRSPEAMKHLAAHLQVHPAIVAGYLRYEKRDYRLLSALVGIGQVRRHFPEVKWGD